MSNKQQQEYFLNNTKAQSLPELYQANPVSPLQQQHILQGENLQNIKFLRDSISLGNTPKIKNNTHDSNNTEYTELVSLLKQQIQVTNQVTNALIQQQQIQNNPQPYQSPAVDQGYSQTPGGNNNLFKLAQLQQQKIQHAGYQYPGAFYNRMEDSPQQINRDSPVQNSSDQQEGTSGVQQGTSGVQTVPQIQSAGAQDHVVQDRIPLPKYEIQPFTGKLHLCEFLQYLLRQKYLLQVTNAPVVQQKLLLNSKLPTQISNISITQAYDPSISLEQYIDFLAKTFGPKIDNLYTQVMNLQLQKYENYLVFIQRITELCTFANIDQQQQVFILNLKLPKHVISGAQTCKDIKSYQEVVKTNIKQGWFDTVDTQYRNSLNFDRADKGYKKGGKKYDKKDGSDAKADDFTEAKSNVDKSHDSDVKTGVARIVVQDSPQNFSFQNQPGLLTFANAGDQGPPAASTRAKKRQHIDHPQGNTGAQNTQQHPQANNQNTSSQHYQQQQQQTGNPGFTFNAQPPQQQQGLNKLYEQVLKQQAELKNQQQQPNKGKGKAKQPTVPEPVPQVPHKANNFYVLDPNRYIDLEANKIAMTKTFNEVCIPTPLNYLLQLTGHHIVPKPDQNIPRNTVYSGSVQNTESDQQFSTTQNQNIDIQGFSNTFENLAVSPQQNFQNSYPNVEQTQGTFQMNTAPSVVDQSNQRIMSFFQEETLILNNQLQKQNFNSVDANTDDQFKSYISDEQHPKISVSIGTIQVEGIIDTGAEQTLVSLEIVQKAGISNLIVKQPENQGVYVTGINGHSRMYGVIPRLELIIQGHEIVWQNIFVQEQPNFELLIGLDMLRIFSFVIELNPTRVSFVPTLDDPRVYLKLLENSSSGPARVAFSKIYKATSNVETLKTKVNPAIKNNLDPIQYFQDMNRIYPDFPFYETYQVIVMDPPWKFADTMHGNGPPYPCLKTDDISKLPIPYILDPKGGIVLMWTTSTQLDNALLLFRQWGLAYKGIFLIWKKLTKSGTTKTGMGYYVRVVYELLLLATQGKVQQFRRPQSKETTITQELIDHSTVELGYKLSDFYSGKPLQYYEQIKKVFNIETTNNLEIFATSRHQFNAEYDLYGNQLDPNFQKQIAYDTVKSQPQIIQNFYAQTNIKRTQRFDKVNTNYQLESYIFNKNKPLSDCFIKQNCANTVYTMNLPKFSQNILNYINNLSVGDVSKDCFEKLQKLLLKYETVFKFDNHLSTTNLGEVDVVLKPHAKPVRMKPYKVVGEAYLFLKQKFQELLKFGLISIGSSDWATAVMCVPKDSPVEKFRAVQNFKKVNQQIIKDKYPLRIIDFLLLNIRGKRYLCVVDMRGGFNQIRRSARSKHIMAMILPFGQFIPEVMFFGETNAPSVFQRFVDMAIGDLYGKGVECYIDDIVVYGDTEEEVLSILEQLLIRLQKANFKLHPEKCQFFTTSANILGHKVQGNTIEPKHKKVAKLVKQDIPKNKKQLQQFLGSVNYYRKFIPNLSVLFKPLLNLLPEQVSFKWNEQAQISYDVIQTFLQNQMQLLLPDLNKPFKVLLSISNFCYSCALVQEDTEGDFVVAFQSQLCSTAQGKLNLYLREVDCLVWALNEFRPYLQHQHFIVYADYKALKFLFENKTQNLQLINYQLQLQDLSFEVVQITGSRLKNLLLLTFLQSDVEALNRVQNQMESLQNNTDVTVKKQKVKSVGSDFKNFDIILQFDGASQTGKFNTMMGSGAFVVYNKTKDILHKESLVFPGSQTNNCAEYQALIAGLSYLKKQQLQNKKTLIQGDSLLIIYQVTYVFTCNSENLHDLCNQARTIIKGFPNHKIEHIDRSYNSLCDSMAKERLKVALQETESVQTNIVSFNNYTANLDYEIDEIICQVCGSRDPEETMLLCDHCNQGYHSDCIGLLEVPDNNWYCDDCSDVIQENINNDVSVDPVEDQPLLQYLNGQIDINTLSVKTKERVQNRARIYTLYNNKLYKLICGQDPKEVPTVGEREILIEQIHQLVGHLGMSKLIHLIKTTYYWPLMSKQIESVLRRCLLCQAQNPHFLSMPGAFPISKGIIPLRAWHFDCIYLPETPRGYTMAVIAICATSKWVESKPIRSNSSTETRDFLWDDIICRYGAPIIIRCDKGKEFEGHFKALIDRLGITQYRISTEYPQANGQSERINRVIKSSLTKLTNSMVSQNYNWDELLQQVMFGIRVTVSRSTKYSPFQILFAQDPVIPGYPGVQNEFQFQFQSDAEQEQFLVNKLQFRQKLSVELQQNLQEMEQEISNTIQNRETISPSDLQFGDIVFVKRGKVIYPQTKTEGPYLFIGYANSDRTTATLIHLHNSKLHSNAILREASWITDNQQSCFYKFQTILNNLEARPKRIIIKLLNMNWEYEYDIRPCDMLYDYELYSALLDKKPRFEETWIQESEDTWCNNFVEFRQLLEPRVLQIADHVLQQDWDQKYKISSYELLFDYTLYSLLCDNIQFQHSLPLSKDQRYNFICMLQCYNYHRYIYKRNYNFVRFLAQNLFQTQNLQQAVYLEEKMFPVL